MLVDTGSSADILYLSTYDKLGLSHNMLQPMHTPLTGFTGLSVYLMGIATMDFTMGSSTKKSTIGAQFTVVDIPDLSYNGFIGRPILTALRAIVCPLHLKLKFPTLEGIREISGNQKKMGMCYQTSVPPSGKELEKAKKRGWENYPEVMSTQCEAKYEEDNSPKERENLKRPVSYEEIVKVPLFKEEIEKTFRIGTMLGEEYRETLVDLIREYKDIFALGQEDMPEIDTSVALYKLHVDSMYILIK
ncbi:hypothetical protein LIER_05405 [Lithospermum erythrorhizon]|uniref:Peptidase A2 domain-containing protein n=1 Tax=Lithospermum erythrorhizon TaxID=34254 RepID=A0AAV3P0L7_LITER